MAYCVKMEEVQRNSGPTSVRQMPLHPGASPPGHPQVDHCQRQVCCAVQKTGMLTRSSGSAYLEIGSTKVTVAVHGPRPPEGKADFSVRGSVNVTVQYAPFSGVPPTKTRVRITCCHGLLKARAGHLPTAATA